MVLNAYQSTQNCSLFTNMATFFQYHVQFSRYKSLKSELWNSHWKPDCSSRKVSTNRCSKTPTINILKCYWGYTLVDWNPWLHFWGIKCFLFLFRMCHAIFREYFQRSRFCLSSAMFVNADLLTSKSSRILLLFYHHRIPRLIGYQSIAFPGAKRRQFGNGRPVYTTYCCRQTAWDPHFSRYFLNAWTKIHEIFAVNIWGAAPTFTI